MATKKELDPYYENVTKAVDRNIKEARGRIDLYYFLVAIIDYCKKKMVEEKGRFDKC